jgi:membrane-associated phospholipid phosphatase
MMRSTITQLHRQTAVMTRGPRQLWAVLHHDLYARRLPPTAMSSPDWALGIAALATSLAVALVLHTGYHGGFHTLNALAPELPAALWENLTMSGDATLLGALSLLFARRHPRLVWQLVVATAIASLLVRCGKIWLPMSRPPGELPPEAFHLIGPGWRGHSFPSGHATTLLSFGVVYAHYFFGATAGVWKRAVQLGGCIGVAAALAATRSVIGVHWPVDVLAGAGVGSLSAWLALRLTARWHWGLTRFGHLFGLMLLVGCAISLLLYTGGYTAPRIPDALIGGLCLLFALRSYGRPAAASFSNAREMQHSMLPAHMQSPTGYKLK